MVYNQSKYDYIYLDNGIVSAIQEWLNEKNNFTAFIYIVITG